MTSDRWRAAALLLTALAFSALAQAAPVQLEDLTWTELRERIAGGGLLGGVLGGDDD